ncbi:MAG TPA: hypothetical protein ENH13_05785 [Euryarchaeota archaeon]|nr:hypothetical protein [Euryarchaeota archaeon]
MDSEIDNDLSVVPLDLVGIRELEKIGLQRLQREVRMRLESDRATYESISEKYNRWKDFFERLPTASLS